MLTAEIDVNRAIANISTVGSRCNRPVCAVVKANAYGHGDELAGYIENYADSFAVATVFEADALIRLGIRKDILVLGASDAVLDAKNVVYSVYDEASLSRLISSNKRIALKINTGMNRLGFPQETVPPTLQRIKKSAVTLDSVFTHFYNANSDTAVSDQFEAFDSVTNGLTVKRHCCATNCLWLSDRYWLDGVRLGLGLYGYPQGYGLFPIMKVYTNVIDIHSVKRGDRVGYGDYVVKSNTRVATLRVGYGDGYLRLKNRPRYVVIGERRHPLIGQVCMDMCMADIGNHNVKVGDRAYLIGEGLTADDLAESVDDINYEVLTLWGNRIKRVYVGK